jgi:hypothetical protein
VAQAYFTDPSFGVGAKGNARGLLVFHEMGMGKTILAISIVFGVLGVLIEPSAGSVGGAQHPPPKTSKTIKFLVPHALVPNIQQSIDKVARAIKSQATDAELAEIHKKFHYASLDAFNMATQITRLGKAKTKTKKGAERIFGDSAPGSLDNSFLFVDEAHILLRAIINSGTETTNARILYNMVMEAKNLQLVLLTGTPSSKHPFEIVPCFNMLAGREILPSQFDTFMRLYVDRDLGVINNKNKLANRLMGMVSHVSLSTPTVPPHLGVGSAMEGAKPFPPQAKGTQARDDGWFPERFPVKVVKVEMSPDQYKQYLLAREKENAEAVSKSSGKKYEKITSFPLALPGAERRAMGTYYVLSRTRGNFVPPVAQRGMQTASMPDSAFDMVSSPKMFAAAQLAKDAPGIVIIYSQFVESGGLAAMGRFLQNIGFTEFKTAHGGDAKEAADVKTAMDKEVKIVADVKTAADKEVKTAADKEVKTAADVKTVADKDVKTVADVKTMMDVKDKKTLKYAVISGDVPTKERDAIMAAERAPENKRGDTLKVVMVSQTGSKGLDFKNVRAVIILEPYWDASLHGQVFGRGARLGGSDDLPREDRDVQPYIFLSVANKAMWDNMNAALREDASVDEQFYARGLKGEKLNLDCRAVLKSVSIECSVLGYGDCRVCVPTDAPLCHDDPELDMKLPDPCRAPSVTSVDAQPLGDTGFYFVKDEKQIHGYRFFEFRKDLNGYAPLASNDKRIAGLITLAIAK